MAVKIITVENLLNPFGKGAAAISLRSIERDLGDRFFKYINPYIKVKCYRKGEDYILLAKVPSERNIFSIKPVFYDVVLEFYPLNKDAKGSMFIRDYGVRVFSNCPSFVYIFTYVYNEKGLLASFVPKKHYVKEALNKEPEVKNPIELIGIEKTVWYTIRFMERNQLFNKLRLKNILVSGGYKEALAELATQEEKLAERESMKAKPKKKGPKNKGGDEVSAPEAPITINRKPLTMDLKKNPLKVSAWSPPSKNDMKASMKGGGLSNNLKMKSFGAK